MTTEIRKKTAIISVLIIGALLFFACFGYERSNWVLELICLVVLPFAAHNAYKYFCNENYRKSLNEYHDGQRALPPAERDGYYFDMYLRRGAALGIIGFGITIVAILLLGFFNLL